MICLGGLVAVYVIWQVIDAIFLISALYGTYFFFKQNKKNVLSPILFRIGSIYFIISCLLMLFALIYSIDTLFNCYKDNPFFLWMPRFLYGFQTYFLWMIQFMRLYHIFKESVFELSKPTIIIMTTMFTIMPIALIMTILPIWPNDDYTTLGGFVSFLFCFTMGLCAWLAFMFIYKLFKVHKQHVLRHQDHTDGTNTILPIITKNTILSFISIALTFIAFLAWSATIGVEQKTIVYISDYLFLLDIYTNFGCILLTYKFFDQVYYMLLGELDAKCRLCCHGIVANSNVKVDEQVECPSPTTPDMDITANL